MVTDTMHASEAAQLKVEEVKSARDAGERPKKRGWANTMGSLIAEALTSGVKKALKVCAYCAKRGE